MPNLIEAAFTAPENIPVIWVCSVCGEIFDFGRIVRHPSRAQVEGLNERFRTHCEIVHPDLAPVVVLALP